MEPTKLYAGLLWAVGWRELLRLDELTTAASCTTEGLPAPCLETVAAIMGYLATRRAAAPYHVKVWAAALAGAAPIERV